MRFECVRKLFYYPLVSLSYIHTLNYPFVPRFVVVPPVDGPGIRRGLHGDFEGRLAQVFENEPENSEPIRARRGETKSGKKKNETEINRLRPSWQRRKKKR